MAQLTESQIALACLARLSAPPPLVVRIERARQNYSGRSRWGVYYYDLSTQNGRPCLRGATWRVEGDYGTRRSAETLARRLQDSGYPLCSGSLHCGRYLSPAQCTAILQQLAR